jgi:putative ABC transport system permease protein
VRAVTAAVRAAVTRRRLQSLVVGVVLLLSTGTAVLGVGLLVVSNAPFDTAFTRQAGAHADVTFDAAATTAGAVAATAGRAGVAAAAGPFDTVSASLHLTGETVPPGAGGNTSVVVGRGEQGGPVDRLTLDSGHWLTGPGQIVLSRAEERPGREVGGTMTVDLPGSPALRIVGVAHSITNTADAWIWPTQNDVLHPAVTSGTASPATGRQMLYRFDSAADAAAVRAGVAAATGGLPADAVLGVNSYLTSKHEADGQTGTIVPFVVAFGVLGLVMSVLIVANVVSGAVVAGYRTIGVLKALGFGPGQVVAVFAGQVLAPALVGCLLGVPLGNALAVPLLGDAQRAYDVDASAILPVWVDLVVVLALLAVVGAAAVVPAWRAGRLAAVQAITVGRAPRTGRGYRAGRLLAATRLPRAVSFGLGTPFARPGRAVTAMLAMVIGVVAVVFATGLSTSLTRVMDAFGRTDAIPVEVRLDAFGLRREGGPQNPGGPRSQTRADPAAVRAIVEAQPGTARVIAATQTDYQMSGVDEPVELTAYDTSTNQMGYQLISGRWYAAGDEVVAGSHLLRTTGHTVGDTLTLSSDRGQRRVRVVGEIFDNANGGFGLVGRSTTGDQPDLFEIALTPGTNSGSYVDRLSTALSGTALTMVRDEENETIAIMLSLIATLTLLLSTVAVLGAFHTAVLQTRERTHEIGVLKAIGMTPRQVRTMVVVSVAGVGLVAGALAVPLGLLLHRGVLPVMADAAETAIPDSVRDVYQPWALVALAFTGVVLAVIGALVPSGWAVRSRVATALRAE